MIRHDPATAARGRPRRRVRPARTIGGPALPEHSMVSLVAEIETGDGRSIPPGSRGAIVFVHGKGEAYIVEFADPFHAVVTVQAANLALAAAAA